MSELHYERWFPHRRRKLIRRSILVLIVLLGLAASTPMLLRELDRMRLVRLYDQCSRMPPPDVAFMEGKRADQPAWRELNLGLQTTIASLSTIFLGKLRTPDGTREYLVGVDLTSITAGEPDLMYMRARTVIRGGPLRPLTYGPVSDQSVVLSLAPKATISGGRVDPKDPSHFTIDVRALDSGRIDGWLKNDGTVILEARPWTRTTAPAPLSPATSP